MKRALFQSRLIDDSADFRSTEAALKAFADNIAPGKKSVDVATEVHRASYAAIGTDDPYFDLKVRADEVAERFMERACTKCTTLNWPPACAEVNCWG